MSFTSIGYKPRARDISDTFAGPSRGRAGPGAIFWSGARMFKGAARRRNPWASGLMRFGLIY